MAGLSLKALVAVAIWGTSFVFTRIALEAFTPLGLVSTRLILGTVVLAAIQRAIRMPPGSGRGALPTCILLGLILAVHLLIQAHGLCYTTAINTGWIVGFMPVVIALAAHRLRRQQLTPRGWIGVAVGATGVWLVTSARLAEFRSARFGDLLQLSTCLTWAAYTLLAERATERLGAQRVTTYAMGAATVFCLAPLVFSQPLVQSPTRSVLAAVLFLGVACSAVAFLLWSQALRDRGPAAVGATLYLEPLVTLCVAVPMLGEPLTSRTLLGGVGVLCGVWLVGKGTQKRG